MTDREKAIVEAYTGVCMLTGEKRSVFNKYVNEIMGRSIFTHMFADEEIQKEIKEKSYDDFIELCKGTTVEEYKDIKLGEFVELINANMDVEIEVRNTDNEELFKCDSISYVFDVYGNCEVDNWWSIRNNGRVVVCIDDSEVMRWIAQDAEEEQKS